MITDENKKLAQWAMDYALKNGCQAAKVLLYSSSNTSFELRDACLLYTSPSPRDCS